MQDSVKWLRSGCDLTQPFPEVDAAEAHRRLLAADDGSREQFWFPLWCPTTDNVMAHGFRVADRLVVPFEFWRPRHPRPEERGRVFVAELPESDCVGVLEQILAALDCSPDAEPGWCEMRKRRGRGEDAIYRRASDNRWVASVSLGADGDGKRMRRVLYGSTKREVPEKLDALRRDAGAGVKLAPAKVTVGQAIERWSVLVRIGSD